MTGLKECPNCGYIDEDQNFTVPEDVDCAAVLEIVQCPKCKKFIRFETLRSAG